MPPADNVRCAAQPAFVPVRPINHTDLAALTERVRRRVIRCLSIQRLLDAAAAADILFWNNGGFSIDASVRITLVDRDVPSSFQSLEVLLRYCARPPFALERLSGTRGPDGRIARIRYVLPRHKAANWVGPGRGRQSTRPEANGVVELSPFGFMDRLADLEPPPLSPARGPPTDWGELVHSMTTATFFKPRQTNYPQSTSTASDPSQARTLEAPGPANSDTVRADP